MGHSIGPLLAALTLAAAPATLAAQTSLPLTHTPEPTVAGITSDDLMTRLYIFAADSMQGREAGTIGNVRGTDYIAAELERMGVEPAGDDGSYFQTVPYKTRTIAETSSITVNGAPLRLGPDFLPMSRTPARVRGLEVVYGGAATENGASITPEQAAGKLVVVASGPFANARRMRGYGVPGAAAVALVALDELSDGFRSYFTRPQGFIDDPDAETGDAAGTPLLLVSEAAAARMFSAPIDQLQPGTAGGSVDVDIRYDVQDSPYPLRNVVGIIPGSDPALRREYVAIGAHSDHIGFNQTPVAHDSLRIWNHVVRPKGADDRGNEVTAEQQARINELLAEYRAAHPGPVRIDSISNGADDDGSGSVSVLEIAEQIAAMNPRPRRSVLLVWHVGEEKGLLGSRWYTDHPTVPRDSIVAQLNMDMVGRGGADDETARTIEGEPRYGGPSYVMLVGSRRLSTELGDLVESVNTENGHGMRFDYTYDVENHPSNIYGRSDHYEYARYGIPIVFFTTGLHSDYHQVTDEPQYIDYENMTNIARLVEDVAVHVANLDHRVRVDQRVVSDGGEGE